MNSFNLVLGSSEIPDTFSLDHTIRTKCLNSKFYSLFHFREKNHFNRTLSFEMTSFFQERYQIDDTKAFKKIWGEIGGKIWTTKLPVTAGTVRQIDQAFQERLVYHGKGISTPVNAESTANQTIQKVVRTLLHGDPLSIKIESRTLKAVLVRKDPEFLAEFRNELQHELKYLAQNPPTNQKEEIVWRAFLGNILSLLPFTYPTDNEIIQVPFLDKNGQCQLVDYQITLIPLTPENKSTPLKALGLTPIENTDASPILSFSGTTYPAGDGFAACLLADFTPGKSVGARPFRQGREKIDAWIKDKTDVHVMGMSLGGALSLQALLNHESKIGRIDIYNPPGPYPWEWIKEYDDSSKIHIYCQSGDFVSEMGSWPTGNNVSLYYVIPHQDSVKEGLFFSHAQVYSGLNKVTIVLKNPKVENGKFSRKVLTYLHLLLSPVVVFYPVYAMLLLYHLIQKISSVVFRTFKRIFGKRKVSLADTN